MGSRGGEKGREQQQSEQHHQRLQERMAACGDWQQRHERSSCLDCSIGPYLCAASRLLRCKIGDNALPEHDGSPQGLRHRDHLAAAGVQVALCPGSIIQLLQVVAVAIVNITVNNTAQIWILCGMVGAGSMLARICTGNKPPWIVVWQAMASVLCVAAT